MQRKGNTMIKNVFKQRYYSTRTNDNGHNVATFWVSRERANGGTRWRGGVTFGTTTKYGTVTNAFDGISWQTVLDCAPRACKSRDMNACKTLYALATSNDNTRNALEGMNVYADVYEDTKCEVWTR